MLLFQNCGPDGRTEGTIDYYIVLSDKPIDDQRRIKKIFEKLFEVVYTPNTILVPHLHFLRKDIDQEFRDFQVPKELANVIRFKAGNYDYTDYLSDLELWKVDNHYKIEDDFLLKDATEPELVEIDNLSLKDKGDVFFINENDAMDSIESILLKLKEGELESNSIVLVIEPAEFSNNNDFKDDSCMTYIKSANELYTQGLLAEALVYFENASKKICKIDENSLANFENCRSHQELVLEAKKVFYAGNMNMSCALYKKAQKLGPLNREDTKNMSKACTPKISETKHKTMSDPCGECSLEIKLGKDDISWKSCHGYTYDYLIQKISTSGGKSQIGINGKKVNLTSNKVSINEFGIKDRYLYEFQLTARKLNCSPIEVSRQFNLDNSLSGKYDRIDPRCK
jgi:hypothetical protein